MMVPFILKMKMNNSFDQLYKKSRNEIKILKKRAALNI
ncbi:hypothetical protein HJ01_01791 [Flavobacterium frigoris PS1]|uniref:Uncharacterized protein n=1 Tax=Flavobacterium frigoris (strain PS1) TaxID=1086011 RepID=H7FR05_FLAFP|nr:hypothetical protein HJ01_01791 [Flavobacterium frigoris PS1]